MKNGKQKWEVQFEEFSNGNLDKKIEQLNEKHNNKGIDVKDYMKQKKQLEKIKENLPKIKNLIEFKDKVSTIKEEIDNELKNRKNISKLNKEQDDLDKENEKLMNDVEILQTKLKSKDISDDDRKKLQDDLRKNDKKRAENNEKYGKNSNELMQFKGKLSKFEKINNEDLEMMSNKLSIQLSKTNFYANRLIKGYSIETIRTSEKAIEWKMKASGKEAKKMEQLKTTVKDDKTIEKITEGQTVEYEKNIMKENQNKIDEEKEIEENEEEKALVNVSEFEKKHPILSKIKKSFNKIKDKLSIYSEEDLEDEIEEIEMEEQEETKEIDEEKALANVSEFEKKHPILSKIKKSFNKIKDKRSIYSEEDLEDEIEKIEREEPEEPEEIKKEAKEEKEYLKEEPKNKHKEFIKILQNMDEYEIFDVAEKGIDGIKEERMSEARKRLQEKQYLKDQGISTNDDKTR